MECLHRLNISTIQIRIFIFILLPVLTYVLLFITLNINGLRYFTIFMNHRGPRDNNKNGEAATITGMSEKCTCKSINQTSMDTDMSIRGWDKCSCNRTTSEIKSQTPDQRIPGCSPVVPRLSEKPLPITGLISFPGAGNTWTRHLLQQVSGE